MGLYICVVFTVYAVVFLSPNDNHGMGKKQLAKQL